MAAAHDQAPLWLFGDQLGPHFHSARGNRDREVLLIISRRALARHRYHRQKLHLVLSAMRHLADELGDRATLIEEDTYRAGLRRFGRPVAVHEPGSHAAARLVDDLREAGLVRELRPTAGFALARTEFQRWAGQRSSPRMEEFYRDQRRRFGVLMDDDGTPAGGRWNYDHDNRAAPPRRDDTLGVPAPWHPDEDGIDERVRRDLDRMTAKGAVHPVGRDGPRRFAATRAEAQRAPRRFLRRRLPHVGPYQDAMLHDDWAMSHALLSVPQNLGLLDPLAVVRASRMSDHCGRRPFDPRERTGEAACPFTAGYWVWLHCNADRLAGNHRMARAVASMRRLDDIGAVVEQEGKRRKV